jgi:hypothetical protein
LTKLRDVYKAEFVDGADYGVVLRGELFAGKGSARLAPT